MLLYFVITILIFETDTFVLKDSYNILLKDNNDYKIDKPINDKDYELIGEEQLTQNMDKDIILYILNKLSSKNYERKTIGSITTIPETELSSISKMTESQKIIIRTQLPKVDGNNPIDYDSLANVKIYGMNGIAGLTTHSHSRRDNIVDDAEYNYDNLLKEYYNDESNYINSNETYHAKIKGKSQIDLLYSVKSIFYFDTCTRNCTEEEVKHIGYQAICCLFQDYRKGKSPRVLLVRLWRIVKIWTGVYLCIAVPLWCTRGWCCCCLVCKFFKPRQTIDEAKRYFVANPPGVLKGANKKVVYEPTDNERDAYEEFEHLIRTI